MSSPASTHATVRPNGKPSTEANAGKAEDTFRNWFFGMMQAGPVEGTDDNRQGVIPEDMQEQYGAQTWGQLINNSIGTLEDDLGVDPYELRMYVDEVPAALEAMTGGAVNYQQWLTFAGDDEKRGS